MVPLNVQFKIGQPGKFRSLNLILKRSPGNAKGLRAYNYTRILIVLAVCLCSLLGARAQNCSQNLEDATRSYYNGQFTDVGVKLEGCLDQLSKDERTDALKLLVDTYLLLGEVETADNYMYELLSVDPDFKIRESDLVEFRDLFESYRILSKYSFGLATGPIRPDYRIIKHQSISGVTREPADYNESPGFYAGLSGNMLLFNNFYLSSGIYYDRRGFEQEEVILDIQSVKSKEREHRLNVPLQIKYIFPLQNIRPFIAGGYSYHYLLKADGDLEHYSLKPTVSGTTIGVPYSEDHYDLTNLRKRSTLNWLVTAGLRSKISGGFILEIGMIYERGFYNLIEEDNRLSDVVLLENFAYIPDDFKMSGWMFSVSILKDFNKPQKR